MKIHTQLKKSEVKYSQWPSEKKKITKEKKGKIVTVEKSIYNLYPVTSPLAKSIETLNEMCLILTKDTLIAMYPICIEYLDDDGKLAKGAITFISADTAHCNQQVQMFEKRALKIVSEKLNSGIEKKLLLQITQNGPIRENKWLNRNLGPFSGIFE